MDPAPTTTTTTTAAAPDQPPSFEAIADALGLSPTAVKRAFSRGLYKLGLAIAQQSELLGYETIEAYLRSGDDRIARVQPEPDGTYTIRIYRPRPEPADSAPGH